MVDTRTDYPADAVAAARAVMLELVRLLGAYRDEIVIVGEGSRSCSCPSPSRGISAVRMSIWP